jgi:phage replication O-like protein O
MKKINSNFNPNFTQKPNIITDKYCRELNGGEYKILDIICRKTYGFHKDIDKISISQFEEYSGMSRPAIMKALKSLEDKNLIIRLGEERKIGSFSINIYKDIDKESLPDINIDKKSLPAIEKKFTRSDKESLHTKETNKQNKEEQELIKKYPHLKGAI